MTNRKIETIHTHILSNNNTLLLTESNLGSPNWYPLLSAAFEELLTTALELKKINNIQVEENQITFSATATSFLRVLDQDVKVCFYIHNDQLECLVRARLPDSWRFSSSYPELPKYTNYAIPAQGNVTSFFYALEFTNGIEITFSSYGARNTSTLDDKLTLVDSSLDLNKTRMGLNYKGQVKLPPSISSIITYIKKLIDYINQTATSSIPTIPTSFDVHGYLEQEPNKETISLIHDFGDHLSLTLKDIFGIEISSLVLYTDTVDDFMYAKSGVELIATLKIGSSSAKVAIIWPIGSSSFIIKNLDEIAFPGFSAFESLLGDHSPAHQDSQFPIPVNNFTKWYIRELTLDLALGQSVSHWLSSVVFSIGPSSSWSHSFLEGAIKIEDLLLEWEVDLDSGSAQKQFRVLSNVELGGGLLHLGASYPDFVLTGELGLYQQMNLSEVFRHMLPAAQLPEVSILDCSLVADVKQKRYELELDIASNWELKLSKAVSIQPLRNLWITLEKSEWNTFAYIDAVMAIPFIDEQGEEYFIDLDLIAFHETSSGWYFSGQIGFSERVPVGHFLEGLKKQFSNSATLPSGLSSLEIGNTAMTFNTQSRDFTFHTEAALDFNDIEVDSRVDFAITHHLDDTFNTDFQGQIILSVPSHELVFDLLFDKDRNSKRMIAAYHDDEGQAISLKDLLSKFGVSGVPDVLSFTIKDAALIHEATENSSNQTSKNLFLAHIDAGINLAGLPLIGKQFSSDKKVELTFQVLYASAAYSSTADTGDEIATINGLLPTGINQLQLKEIKKGPSVATTLCWGKELIPIALPIDTNDDQSGTTEPLKADSSVSQPNGSTRNSVSNDSGTWINVQKKLGPVHLHRIGVQYQDQKVWMLFDASLALGGLTIGLEGLGVGSSLTKIDPQFTLHGIAIDYQKEGAEIGASLLRGVYNKDSQGNTVPEYEEYNGIATLKMEELSIAAIGSYTTINGEASLFVYALVNDPLGGPAFFFVTGLAVGFGYNRDLLIPPVEQLTSFPLVAQAIRGDGLPPDPGRDTLLQELENLHNYLTPKTDQYFLAVGVKFTTFKIVDSFALVTLAFGKQFAFNLLGLSTLLVPPSMEGEQVDKDPLAEIQVALRATYMPEEGVLKIDARLTPNSYILSRKCRLTGGFAFYSWFKGPHAGDFVVTLGGYHPHFHVPAHYPIVPRLAFNWQVDSHTNIKGDMYFALCAHALMAGGHLTTTYHAGPLKVWFTIGADFLIAWKPYHYDAKIYVSMGGSFTYHFFGTHHISVHLGADLHVWGPDFGGHAKIHIWVVSIGVSFGDQSSREAKAIDWPEFRESFLPQDDQMVSLQVADGLVTRGDTDDDLGVINPKHLVITTDSVIPSNVASFLGEDKTPAGIGQPAIGPMEIGRELLHTKHTVTIKKIAPESIGPEALREHFSPHPILKKVPAALWGTKLNPEVNGEHFLDNGLTGFRITPAGPPKADRTKSINKSNLRFDLSPIPNAFHRETESPDNQEAIALESPEQMNAMKDSNEARNSLLQALNMSSEDLDFSQSPGHNFLYPNKKAA
ncbi:MAG: hypothetical protein MGF17_00760 [Trichodesmium sp. MAG_R04]|nr:hypothetical protein [Trichodesmium sp. MAG_R04]